MWMKLKFQIISSSEKKIQNVVCWNFYPACSFKAYEQERFKTASALSPTDLWLLMDTGSLQMVQIRLCRRSLIWAFAVQPYHKAHYLHDTTYCTSHSQNSKAQVPSFTDKLSLKLTWNLYRQNNYRVRWGNDFLMRRVMVMCSNQFNIWPSEGYICVKQTLIFVSNLYGISMNCALKETIIGLFKKRMYCNYWLMQAKLANEIFTEMNYYAWK